MKKKILFVGGSSFLAHSWCNYLDNKSEIFLGVHNRAPELKKYSKIELNFDSEKDLIEKISSLNLDLIINCVGYTNVENCEINYKDAIKLIVKYYIDSISRGRNSRSIWGNFSISVYCFTNRSTSCRECGR